MTDRPIIMSAASMRGLLAEPARKFQTRRILKPQPFPAGYHDGEVSLDRVGPDRSEPDGPVFARFSASAVGGGALVEDIIHLPYAVGDRLWVREGFSLRPSTTVVWYRAESEWADDARVRWSSPIHMPRRFSRVTLTVSAIRVERLQDISEADVRAEGCEPQTGRCRTIARDVYAQLWESLHGPGSWALNPFVSVTCWDKVERGNIDA